jgi:hypothetical protein
MSDDMKEGPTLWNAVRERCEGQAGVIAKPGNSGYSQEFT